jgi:hypothetical protein
MQVVDVEGRGKRAKMHQLPKVVKVGVHSHFFVGLLFIHRCSTGK